MDNSADDTSAKSHTLFQDRPAPNTPRFPIPEVVREIGAEDPVQQIVKLFVPPTLEFGDIDPDLLVDIRREFEGWLPAFQRLATVPDRFPTRCAPLPERVPFIIASC